MITLFQSSSRSLNLSILLLSLLFFFGSFASFTSGFAITGGGNFTNFSNVTGGAINITGAGYYYFVRSSTAATPATGQINYTSSTATDLGQDSAISIESPNVVVDCRYPSLPSSIIAGPTSGLPSGGQVVGVIVNATRTLNALDNITIRNCIFTNFSKHPSAGIYVIGNVSNFLIYNNSFNDSSAGLRFGTNGTSGVFSGSWVNVNISTNRFYNITSGASTSGAYPISINNSIIPGSTFSNSISIYNSTIEHNNFTWIFHEFAIEVVNSSNITVFNNTIYNSFRGMFFGGVNGSNFSNNNVTNLYGDSNTYGIIAVTPRGQTPDLSSVPNIFSYNFVLNTTCCGVAAAGIATNLPNSNITYNLMNYSPYGVYAAYQSTGALGPTNLFIAHNRFGNATIAGLGLLTTNNTKVYNNSIFDSFLGITLQTGSNYTSLVSNLISNSQVGYYLIDAYSLTSQDDSISGASSGSVIFGGGSTNLTAVNLSANLATVSMPTSSTVNFTVKHPVSVTVRKASDGSALSSAAVSVTGNGVMLNSSAVLDSSGTAHYNLTTYRFYDSHGSLTALNLTPTTFGASLAGYFDGSTSGALPTGTFAAEQAYVISLTAFAHSSSSDSSGSSTPAPVVEPVTSPTSEPESPVADSNPTNSADSQSGRSSNIVNDAAANQSSVSGQANVGAQAGSISLDLPVVGNVQVDPLVAVAVVVVVVLIVLILMGMM